MPRKQSTFMPKYFPSVLKGLHWTI